MTATRRTVLALVWLIVLIGVGVFISKRLQVSGDLRKFMPSAETPAQKLLLDELGEGPGSRLLLMSLAGADAETLAAQSQRIAQTLAADERFSLVANGGEDSGPSPHDLYDSALGACKALTMLWYAKRKQIPLASIDVSVERDASDERNGTYRLKTLVALGGDLSDAQRAELLNVAKKCPVHKLMTQVTTEIETDWLV